MLIRRRLPTLAVAAVCAVLAVYLMLNARDASYVRDANEAGAAGRFDDAIRLAGKAQSAPASARALVAIARAHTAAGTLDAADRAWAAAARRDPNNWLVHYEWAQAHRALHGRAAAARRHYARARELNPKLPAAAP